MNIENDYIFSRPDKVIKHRHGDAGRADLFVMTTIFNPVRFRSRWKLYQDFAKRVKQSGAQLYVAEVALGHRDFIVGTGNDPIKPDYVLHLETTSELWYKEAALNLLASRLPVDWQYLAIVDADVSFARDDWANETLQRLQHHDVVQMWSHAQDLGPEHEPLTTHHSFAYSYAHDLPPPPQPGYYYAPEVGGAISWHPGWAWAWRKKAFNDVGRFIDFAILGAADNHMAKGLIGDAANSVHPEMTEMYRNRVLRWQKDALFHIKKNIGYVPGLLLHYFHGTKLKRKYWDRWRILVDMKFNPDTDLKLDWQGLHQLVVDDERSEQLRDLERGYFHARDEDATLA